MLARRRSILLAISLLVCHQLQVTSTTTNVPLNGRAAANQLIAISDNEAANAGAAAAAAAATTRNDFLEEPEIFIESIEDLDQLSYLTLRNYNLTDDGLVQSSWLMGLGSVLGSHKLQRQQLDGELASATGSLASPASGKQSKLPLVLESFISHLRNGHLKRTSSEDLEQISSSLNLTETVSQLSQKRLAMMRRRRNENRDDGRSSSDHIDGESDSSASQLNERLSEEEFRCVHLVARYKFDLNERLKQAQQQQQSRAEVALNGTQTEGPPESDPQQPTRLVERAPPPALDSNSTVNSDDNKTASEQRGGRGSAEVTDQAEAIAAAPAAEVDEIRLIQLCKLVMSCRSADQLVGLISKPWRESERQRLVAVGDNSQLERDSSQDSSSQLSQVLSSASSASSSSSSDQASEPMVTISNQQPAMDEDRASRRKSLHDSLSLSLAKLCPLILFPLHEDDGQCVVKRNDRPPLLKVWGLATLFVTIVCSCSLIGLLMIMCCLCLSPAPADLPSPAAADDDDDDDELAGDSMRKPDPAHSFVAGGGARKQRPYETSLTLFEGLAVGSLVGSALSSLIPQAFELQERESNHSFLLKAIIIFLGIYLFFLSERIVRIILDSRQRRKKKKRQTLHRSSTAAAIDGLMGDGGSSHHNQNQHQHQHQHQHPSSTSRSQYADASAACDRGQGTGGSSAGKKSARRAGGGGVGDELGGLEMKPIIHSRPTMGSSNNNKNRAATTTKRSATQRNEPLGKRESDNLAGAGAAVGQQQVRTKVKKQAESKTKQQHARPRTMRTVSGRHTGAGSAGTSGVKSAGGRNQLPATTRRQRQRQKHRDETGAKRARIGSQIAAKKQSNVRAAAAAAASPVIAVPPPPLPIESDLDEQYYHFSQMSSTPSSLSTCSSTSSFSSYTRQRLRTTQNGLIARLHQSEDSSQVDYSFSSTPRRQPPDLSACSSCGSLDGMPHREQHHLDLDSDHHNNNQARAVSKQMSKLSRQLAEQHEQQQQQHRLLEPPPDLEAAAPANGRDARDRLSPSQQTRTSFRLDEEEEARQALRLAQARAQSHSPAYFNYDRNHHHHRHHNQQAAAKQDISTVAWMIILGDGLHNFIDGISIGAAFSESILSGVSISVAVMCEEIPHELGDFAVLVSAGMTVRQALGYNFLSACTCYLGMAVGIILGDVTDGASYISALAAGVFLYIALVDMMGELSAALEESSRDSLARTLKLFVLQNVGIIMGIAIIFFLSFFDF